MMEKEYIDRFSTLVRLANKVYAKLGWGFKEEIYQDALEKELISSNIPYIREKHLSVYYNTGNGEATELQHTFRADFYCYNSIIVEIKSKYIDEKGKLSVKQQINNYMAATKSNYALMLNFYGNNDNVYYTTFPHNLWLEIKDNINPSINCPEEQLERIL